MFLIDQIAETRIQEAMAQGDFDDLPGAGKPLSLDDDVHVPEELRVAYRILRNAGCIPPTLELRREISQVEHLLAHLETPTERTQASRRLHYLMARLNLSRDGLADLRIEEAYYAKLVDRLEQRE
jgi:hypothetical protein